MTAPLVLVILLTIVLTCAYAQDGRETIDLQQLSDDHPDLAEDDEGGEAGENLIQMMTASYDLNRVSAEELRLLGFLTEVQIENFIAYRRDQQTIQSVYELQVIPGFDRDVIMKMAPRVKVSDPASRIDKSLLQRVFTPGHAYLITRYARTIEKPKGFRGQGGIAPPYAGSPAGVYVRFRSNIPGDFSVGFTGEKDPGEVLSFRGGVPVRGFDFTSFHLQVRDKGKLRNIIIGDYQAQFGQGLLLGSAFGIRKGGDAVSGVRRSHLGFLPHTGLNETRLLRGLAATADLAKVLRLSFFLSHTRRDASTDEADNSRTVSSLPASGLHRTAAERAGRKYLGERHAGVVADFHLSQLRAGIIVEALRYRLPVVRTPSPYNQFAFRGRANNNLGIFLNYQSGNVSFFSEAARSASGGAGGLVGVLVSPAPKLEISMLYRHYDRNFHTFIAGAFSENTAPQNERGAYWGWKYKWSRRHDVSGYVDLFRFPWTAFRRYRPADGYEWGLRGNFLASRESKLFLQLREESKPRNLTETSALYRITDGIRRTVTLHCEYGVASGVRLRSRLQYNNYQQDGHTTEGWAVMQDISFRVGRFRFSGRHALFETDQHDNRLYVYEQDAWLLYSFPAYSGTGVRNYALMEFRAHERITLWLRYARTRLLAAEEIGTGTDAIDGNTRNDVKFQVRITF